MRASDSKTLNAARREAYAVFGMTTTLAVLMFALTLAAGRTTLAVLAAVFALMGAFQLVRVLKHGAFRAERGAWVGDAMVRRYRRGVISSAAVGLALVTVGVLWAVAGEFGPALVFSLGAGFAFLVSASTFVNERWVEDVAAAVADEPVRVICHEGRALWPRREPPSAFVLTSDRIAKVRASASGVTDVGSIAIPEITSMEANLARGNLLVRGGGVVLGVTRAVPLQVHAVFEALREADVPEGPEATRMRDRA